MNTMTNADRMTSASMDRMTEGAHQAVDRFAERAAPVVEQVRNATERATDQIGQKLDQLSSLPEAWTGSLREQVRARPLAVVCIATVAGVLLGRLMR